MSRHRKDAHDSLPLSAPGSAADAADGKPHKRPATRALRFLRTRPVTAAVLLLGGALCSAAAFALAHGVLHVAGLHAEKAPPPAAGGRAAAAEAAAAAAAVEAARVAAEADAVEPPGRKMGEGHGEKKGRKAGEEEVDNFDDVRENGAVGARVAGDGNGKEGGVDGEGDRKAGVVGADAAGKECHRKFEPGFLDSNESVCVTDEFFFDIAIDAQAVGRIVIGVFGKVVPKSAANFRALATCTGAFADEKLCYRGDSFHRVAKRFVIQGGSKATGRSIYGPTFEEAKSKEQHSFLSHAQKGVVSWAEYPIGSQFFVLTHAAAKYLDGNHVVYGFVTDGMDVLDKIAEVSVDGDKPKVKISISDCGDLHGPSN